MLGDDEPLRHALRARRPHVVLGEGREHRGARVAHEDGGDAGAEHEGRQDRGGDALPKILPQRHVARGRQPAEGDGEEQYQHDPEPEIRRGDAEQRDAVDRPIRRAVAPHGREHAAGHADNHADGEAHHGELRGHRQLLEDEVGDRHLDAPGEAEIAVQQPPQPVAVLLPQRPVEQQLAADLGQHARVAALLAREDEGRVAGHELLQAEHQQRDDEERGDDLAEAAKKKGRHGARAAAASSASPRRARRIAGRATIRPTNSSNSGSFGTIPKAIVHSSAVAQRMPAAEKRPPGTNGPGASMPRTTASVASWVP